MEVVHTVIYRNFNWTPISTDSGQCTNSPKPRAPTMIVFLVHSGISMRKVIFILSKHWRSTSATARGSRSDCRVVILEPRVRTNRLPYLRHTFHREHVGKYCQINLQTSFLNAPTAGHVVNVLLRGTLAHDDRRYMQWKLRYTHVLRFQKDFVAHKLVVKVPNKECEATLSIFNPASYLS
jgi:hypothetical protein